MALFGQKRVEPGPGQESVWDYPRPPRLEDTTKHIQIIFNGEIIADTTRSKRILETSHPPVYYVPPEDVKMQFFSPNPRHTYCEWKGEASYYDLTVEDKSASSVAWYYPEPTAGYEGLKDYIAVYPSRMDRCLVDGEEVQPQGGDFYGGWITSAVVGPFKGS